MELEKNQSFELLQCSQSTLGLFLFSFGLYSLRKEDKNVWITCTYLLCLTCRYLTLKEALLLFVPLVLFGEVDSIN